MPGGVKTDVKMYQMLINGEWVASKSAKTFPVYDPSTEEAIAQVPDANVDDVNRACVLAFNHRMGPLDTMDLTGLDTALHVATAMTEQYGERFLAPQNIRALVAAGHLGRKTGRGFTDHSTG